LFGFETIGQNTALLSAIAVHGGRQRRRRRLSMACAAHPIPLVDLSLLKIDSFRLSVISGSLMRVTQGAQPFPAAIDVPDRLRPVGDAQRQLILATSLGAMLMRSATPRCCGWSAFAAA
jgi:hypothetical protein